MQTSFRHRWGRSLATAGVALVVGLACGTSQGTPTTAQNVPGVTSNEILIGTTTPLSGAASVYASISKGVTAYFNYVNDHGGINGRKVTYKVYDDAYDPSKSVPLVRQLITQDQVFAVFNELGTPVNLATRDYINQQGVPDLFVATGSSHWGSDYKQFPWTIGYQPDYVSESKIYAKDILYGLQAGLVSKASSMTADTETYEANAADVTSQTAAIKAKGADLLFIAATPKFAGQAIAGASQLNWKPAIYLNSVSNQVSTVKASIAASKPDAAEGMTSTVYLKNAADQAKWGSDPGMQLYMSIMSKYCAGCDAVNDGNYIYGMSVAWVFQQVIQKAGRDGITRQNVMNNARNMSYKNSPFLLPGISVLTNGTNQFPVTQEALEHWQGTGWVVDNTIINAR